MKKFIKEYYNKAPENSTLDNLNEKLRGEYCDEKSKRKNKVYELIAEDLAVQAESCNFDANDDDGLHSFIRTGKEIARKIGLDEIILCNYKGYMYSDYSDIKSNYILNSDKLLYIDVYGCYGMDIEILKGRILQELRNLKRDVSWVVNDTYEENMKIMQIKKNLDEYGLC